MEEWMWQLEPGSSILGLAMKVTALPWPWAISLVPFL